MKRADIERVLATAPTGEFVAFLSEIGTSVNICHTRGHTAMLTVVPGRYDAVLAAAKKTRVTLQRRREDVPEGSPPDDYWELVHRGLAKPWKSRHNLAGGAS